MPMLLVGWINVFQFTSMKFVNCTRDIQYITCQDLSSVALPDVSSIFFCSLFKGFLFGSSWLRLEGQRVTFTPQIGGNAIVILGDKNKNDLPSIYSRLLHTGQWFLCAFLITCVAVVLKNLMTSYRIASMTCRKDFCCCSLMSKHVKSTQSLTAAALLFIHHQCVFVSFTCGRQGRYNRLRSDRCRLWVAHGALHSWLTWALRGNGFCALPVPPPPGHVGSVCFCKP